MITNRSYMVIATTMVFSNATHAHFISPTCVSSGISFVGLAANLQKTTFASDQKPCSVTQLCSFRKFKRMTWSIGSGVGEGGFSPSSSNGSDGRTRLIRVIQALQTKLGARIQEVKKNLPMKLFFFLVGFYCATAFATVIGQTGDWDILSAALAVVVVEGIGALMYRSSLPLLSRFRRLITMFNYWKAGLSLGLFLDSFKYEIDNIIAFSSPFTFELDLFPVFL